MIRFLADEDFNGRIVRGLFLRRRDLDLVRVQDVGLQSADDAVVPQWTDEHSRILLTHDLRTLPNHVRNRLAAGLHVPGVLVVDDLAPIGACLEDIELVIECSEESEWQDRIVYLPFR
jgi:hypothetical protein